MQTRKPTLSSSQHSPRSGGDLIKPMLRQAKKLHRAAISESKVDSLPVLRRLIASQVLRHLSLPDLYRRRNLVQRKHLLQLLAVEASYESWAEYRRVLSQRHSEAAVHYSLLLQDIGYPNLWFRSLEEAEAYTKQRGGRAVVVGQQALVISADESISSRGI